MAKPLRKRSDYSSADLLLTSASSKNSQNARALNLKSDDGLAKALEELRRDWSPAVEAGCPTSWFWMRLRGAAADVEMTLVDRYALAGLVEEDGRKESVRIALDYLLGLPSKGLRIFCSDKGAPTQSRAYQFLEGYSRSLRIYVAPDNIFARRIHDRYLRIGETVVWMGEGIRMVSEKSIMRPGVLAFGPTFHGLSKIENGLLEKASLQWSKTDGLQQCGV